MFFLFLNVSVDSDAFLKKITQIIFYFEFNYLMGIKISEVWIKN